MITSHHYTVLTNGSRSLKKKFRELLTHTNQDKNMTSLAEKIIKCSWTVPVTAVKLSIKRIND